MNRLRHILADRIERNCGYNSSRWERSPLEWTARFHPNLDIDYIHRKTGDSRPIPDSIRGAWDESGLWAQLQEAVSRGLLDGDDCAYRTPSLPAATRWGFQYYRPLVPIAQRYKRRTNEMCFYPVTGASGWVKVDPYTVTEFDVKFGIYGRGGKHVVLTEFEGRDLDMSSKDLAEAIREDEEGLYPNEWCRKLLMMMDDWDEMITSKAAREEGEYLATEQLRQDMDEWYTEDAERQAWAERDVVTVG